MGNGLDVKIFLLLQAAGVGQGVATPLVGAFYHHFLQSLSDRFLVRQRIPFGIDFYVRQRGYIARTTHKFSTAATQSSDLTALHSVGLLNVLQRVRLRGPRGTRLRVTPCQVGTFVAS